MPPLNKAAQLISKFLDLDPVDDIVDIRTCEFEKQCALITVEEILQTNNDEDFVKYWTEVKHHIETTLNKE